MSKLWYKRPAADWYAALPIGNGQLGAMVYGNPIDEKIQLNEKSIWSGRFIDRDNSEASQYRDQVRDLINRGEIQTAEMLAKHALLVAPGFKPVYQTAGEMTIALKNRDEEIQDYYRELNMDTAIALTTFSQAGSFYRREVFASNPDQVIVAHMGCSKRGGLSFSTTLNADIMMTGISYQVENSQATVMMLGGQGTRFAVAEKIIPRGGTLKRIGQYIIVEDADEVRILVAIATDAQGEDPQEIVKARLSAIEPQPYELLRKRHVDDYSRLYSRVRLSLTDKPSSTPTDEQIKNFEDDANNLSLVETFFDYGRYLLIASSRAGTLPANLQGVWNQDVFPRWGSKYTLNINTEMNYWPAESTNLPETEIALFDFMERMYQHGKKTAEIMYHVNGWVAHHSTDLWGDTTPSGAFMPASFWCLGAAWLSTHVWRHYQYTEDEAFLKKYSYLVAVQLGHHILGAGSKFVPETIGLPVVRS